MKYLIKTLNFKSLIVDADWEKDAKEKWIKKYKTILKKFLKRDFEQNVYVDQIINNKEWDKYEELIKKYEKEFYAEKEILYHMRIEKLKEQWVKFFMFESYWWYKYWRGEDMVCKTWDDKFDDYIIKMQSLLLYKSTKWLNCKFVFEKNGIKVAYLRTQWWCSSRQIILFTDWKIIVSTNVHSPAAFKYLNEKFNYIYPENWLIFEKDIEKENLLI